VSDSLTMRYGRRRWLRIGLSGVATAAAFRVPGSAAQTSGSSSGNSGGSLEVHALDATIGRPAEGVMIDLFLVST
jgi:hypothetical protein